jgi:hypothetical protein
MQAHNNSGTIQLCHTSCSLFNGGTLQSYLQSVKSWINSNPNDVVSLLIVNSDGFAPSQYDTVFKAVGLDTLSYSPPSATTINTAWPSLGSMIDSGKRLVTFMDTGANFNSVPYIIDEFTNMWETAFDVTDTTFDCNVNRSKGDTSTELFLINHFLDKIVWGRMRLTQKTRTSRIALVERDHLAHRCRRALPRRDGVLILCLSTSTSLAVVVSSKWRPRLMVSRITHRRQYLAHVLQGRRRARRLPRPSQTMPFLNLESES